MRAYSIWIIVLSVLTSIGSATLYLRSEIENIVSNKINQHDHGYKDDKPGEAHSDLRESNVFLLNQLEELKDRYDADRNDLIQVYWYLIGYTVVDSEPIKQLRAAAAASMASNVVGGASPLASNRSAR